MKREPASVGNGDSTSVVYLENIDWGGAFQGLLMNNIVPNQLRIKTDDILAHIDEKSSLYGSPIVGDFGEDIEFTEMGINPNFTRNLRTVTDGEVGLGEDNVISQHERYKNRDRKDLRNPMHDADKGGTGAVGEKSKEKSLPPHVARSASGGYLNTKRLGTKGGWRRDFYSKTGPNRESNKPPAAAVEVEEVVVTEAKVEKKAENRWEAVFDETRGYYYYYDKNTHETTWEKPDDL